MRTEGDVIRSVKRYFALALGDAWEVRLWEDEGSFAAPFARVAESGPALYTSKRFITDVVMPVQVHLYPVPSDTVTGAINVARGVRETVVQAIEVGVNGGWPRRIPLYDYDGLVESQPSSARNTFDFVRVMDLSVNSVPDSDEPTAVVVVVDMRLAWSRVTTVDAPGETVNSLRVTQRAG